MVPDQKKDVTSQILQYAGWGFHVVPLYGVVGGVCLCSKKESCPGNTRGKHPKTAHGVKDASRDVEIIKGWCKNRTVNWGIATGMEIGETGEYLVVIDVDPRNGGDDSLVEIQAKYGKLPDTVMAKTGGGGWHYLFKTKEPCPTYVAAEGIEIKGVGGYIVVDPSSHYSGNSYEWDCGYCLGDYPIAEAPEWLVSQTKKKAFVGEVSGSAKDTLLGAAFEDAGRLGIQLENGKWAVHCPWAHEHSDTRGTGEDSSTVILPAVDGTNFGGFQCLHSHCMHRKWKDVLEALPPHSVSKARTLYPFKPQLVTKVPTATPESPSDTGLPVWPGGDAVLERLKPFSSQKGGYQRSRVVIEEILEHDTRWKGVLRRNQLKECVEAVNPPWMDELRPSIFRDTWTDEDDSLLASWLKRNYGVDFNINDVRSTVEVTASHRAYHPIREYLESITWDGVPRVAKFFVDYYEAYDNAYNRGVAERWLISAVARVMQPGCKVDNTVILEGLQDIGKSTGLKNLFSEDWFYDSHIDFSNKDAMQVLRGKWCIELAEIDALNRGELTRVKAFLTSSVDNYRASFARRTAAYPRQCVFAGTTNEGHYLRDSTGNRRFWPVMVKRAHLDDITRDRDQIWAEALVLYRSGKKWYDMSNGFKELCANEQERRYQNDPWEFVLEEYCQKNKEYNLNELLSHPLNLKPGEITSTHTQRVAKVLTRLGFKQDARMFDEQGRRVRLWRKDG